MQGIDFVLDTVISYDFPHSTTDYIHRVGRTGRAGRVGKVHLQVKCRTGTAVIVCICHLQMLADQCNCRRRDRLNLHVLLCRPCSHVFHGGGHAARQEGRQYHRGRRR